MRLADFILANVEPILAEWVAFARTLTPEKNLTVLRDHAAEILRASVRDMNAPQTPTERSDKSKGDGEAGKASQVLDSASADHAIGRVSSGYDVNQMVSEYRALRASVIRLWRESRPDPDLNDLDDLTRFNESIDQSLSQALRSYSHRVDESREMFLAILGHDLRNPLAAIALAGRALQQDKALSAPSAELVRGVSSSAFTMQRLIRDILDFAVTRMGRPIPIARAAMDLGHLCRQVVDETRTAHPTRTVHLHAQGDLNGSWDSARLWQVLSNLLGNAIQHGAPDAPIDFSISGAPAEVVVNVHNSGTPIPSEYLPSLFSPMSRSVPHDSTRRPGSIGLGLYIVKEIVTAHGGTVAAESSADSGTDFTIRLPRIVAPA